MGGDDPTKSPDVANNQTRGVSEDNLPVFAPAMKQRMAFSLGWSERTINLPRWKEIARSKLWELTLQNPIQTDFASEMIDEVDRGAYVARKVAFNLTNDSRVVALLLMPKGTGPFPAAVMYHDHGSMFDIGKEKLIESWDDEAKLQTSKTWAERFFSSRYPGDALARRGYVVLATDALGWSDSWATHL